jgi:hypothetical protein
MEPLTTRISVLDNRRSFKIFQTLKLNLLTSLLKICAPGIALALHPIQTLTTGYKSIKTLKEHRPLHYTTIAISNPLINQGLLALQLTTQLTMTTSTVATPARWLISKT